MFESKEPVCKSPFRGKEQEKEKTSYTRFLNIELTGNKIYV